MRKLLTTFVCVWFTLAVWAGDGIYEKLQQIPQISEIQKLDVLQFQIDSRLRAVDALKASVRHKNVCFPGITWHCASADKSWAEWLCR